MADAERFCHQLRICPHIGMLPYFIMTRCHETLAAGCWGLASGTKGAPKPLDSQAAKTYFFLAKGMLKSSDTFRENPNNL